MAFIYLTTIIVEDYDKAIDFFVQVLKFDLVEDSPAVTSQGGRPKRWVVVRPPGGQTGILLARADGEHQVAAVGNQHAGRVGFFLRVGEGDSDSHGDGSDNNHPHPNNNTDKIDAFDAYYNRLCAAGVRFVSHPRSEPYGRVAVFLDIAGNRWDLLGPVPAKAAGASATAGAPAFMRSGQEPSQDKDH